VKAGFIHLCEYFDKPLFLFLGSGFFL